MKISRLLSSLLLILVLFQACAQSDEIRLIVRVDDMGFSHAANTGIMKTFEKGIATSVEVMVPGPWFEECVKMLNEHPEIDAGIHLVLTSEWENLKWRPLTKAPGLSDDDGYFHPFIWPNDKEGVTFLKEDEWTIEEVEAEFRAQIELAKKKIPHLSHFSAHMGCWDMTPEVNQLVRSLAKEYDLSVIPADLGFQRFRPFVGDSGDPETLIKEFQEGLRNLIPGDYLFVEHPGEDVSELRAVKHEGYTDVAQHREAVTHYLTHPETLKIIEERNIKLISYKDLK